MAFDQFAKSGYAVDWLVAIAAGKVPGFAILNKHGRNEEAGTIGRPLWDGGNLSYTFLEAAEGMRAYSDDNTATNALEFHCLDANWGTVTVNASLTGTTPINLGTQLRCHRIINREPGRTLGILGGYVEVVGSGAIAAGTAGAAAMLKAKITPPFEQTEMTVFSVPANQTLQIFAVWGGMNESSGVSAVAMDLELWVGGSNSPMLNKRVQGFTNLGANPAYIPYGVPFPVESKSDVELRVKCDATGKDVSGGFCGLLIDN